MHEYDCNIEYLSSRDNVVVDALSHREYFLAISVVSCPLIDLIGVELASNEYFRDPFQVLSNEPFDGEFKRYENYCIENMILF